LKNSVFSLLAAALVCVILAPWLGRSESSVSAAPAPASTPTQVVVNTTPSVATLRDIPAIGDAIDMAAAEAAGVSLDVLQTALSAVQCGMNAGDLLAPPTLTLIDYSRPSVEPRLWVFDLASGRMLFKELVAHGRNTGENMATRFSDDMNSHQSSLGLFVTGDTYVGNNGYSLRLDGLEPGFNSHARERAVVMHGAPYVNAALATSQGRIGRSWGCPALREAVARDVIDTIRGGGVIFSYYPDQNWLARSKFVNCGGGVEARRAAVTD
jgi:L,D-transpeptidase-like protein